MKYKRPDMSAIKSEFKNGLKKFIVAVDFYEAEKAMNCMIRLKNDFETMRSICFIRFTQDINDKEYTAEQDFFDSSEPVFINLYADFYKALLESKFKVDIIDKYGKQIFNIANTEVKNMSEAIIEDKMKENSLCTEYQRLTASGKVFFEGKEMNIENIYPYFSSAEREKRKEATKSYWKFYSDNSDKFDEIFNDLIKIRNEMALKLGYRNFVELGYSLLNRTDYDAQMVQDFGECIYKYFLPVRKKLKERKRIRLGLDKINFYDNSIYFSTGNAKPKGNTGWIAGNAKKMFSELSAETKEFYEFMEFSELMDLENREGKSGGGYCTFINNYKSPFIFSNMNGTDYDIGVLIHESGHAFQRYLSKDFYFPEYLLPTMESCEIHSIGMEFLTYPWMELFFKEDSEKYKFSHLSNSVGILSFQVMVDIFQIWVYENPLASDVERNSKWKELRDKYLLNEGYDEFPFLQNGNDWKDIFHIFICPFYYIDYTLAGICALQFWSRAINKNKFQEAWKDYVRLCKLGGSMSFLNLIKEANLESPFEEKTIQKLAKEVEEYLDSVDDLAFN